MHAFELLKKAMSSTPMLALLIFLNLLSLSVMHPRRVLELISNRIIGPLPILALFWLFDIRQNQHMKRSLLVLLKSFIIGGLTYRVNVLWCIRITIALSFFWSKRPLLFPNNTNWLR